MSSSHQHHKSESKLLDNSNGSDYNNLIHDTNTEVSLVTGVEYGGGPEAGTESAATTVLKGKLALCLQIKIFKNCNFGRFLG